VDLKSDLVYMFLNLGENGCEINSWGHRDNDTGRQWLCFAALFVTPVLKCKQI
jgi:hypothetical protein